MDNKKFKSLLDSTIYVRCLDGVHSAVYKITSANWESKIYGLTSLDGDCGFWTPFSSVVIIDTPQEWEDLYAGYVIKTGAGYYINIDKADELSLSFKKEDGTRFTKKRALKWLEGNVCNEKGPGLIEDAI